MPRPFRFGLTTTGTPNLDSWTDLARKAEYHGYATLLMPDRPIIGGFSPIPALTMAAAVITTLRLGSYVFANDYRHPIMLAKEVATLDILSDGRFELGIGAGVSPMDYQQMGIPFGAPGERVGRMFEAVAIIKQMFTSDRVAFSGKHYQIAGAAGLPKPLQKPHPPIFIGSAGKRVLQFAAREAQIIGPAIKWSPQGNDPADATLEEKIGWIRDAAGERFSQIELNASAYDIALTDNPVAHVPQPGGPPTPKRHMTTAQASDYFQEQRDRYGFSYFQVFQDQLENFAPVVAQLAGK